MAVLRSKLASRRLATDFKVICALDAGPMSAREVRAETRLPSGRVLGSLCRLQQMGHVRRCSTTRWRLVGS